MMTLSKDVLKCGLNTNNIATIKVWMYTKDLSHTKKKVVAFFQFTHSIVQAG